MAPEDEARWTAVQGAAEPFLAIDDKLFSREFGHDQSLISERCFLLLGPQDKAVGCISAWMDHHYCDEDYGRIHWVAIVPEHQGKGLAKPMLAAAMETLARFHQRAYLVTSSLRLPAINLYARFGFRAHIRNDEDRACWQTIAAALPQAELFLREDR